ncbi:hypothetical protein [Hydrogenophaga sp.]|uniref:hypothetical protein n=1 Tax=Hydrogenophaga sp. TaxID=1904254 RepID=UPI00261E6537|nr:hypothetical protein [Hydrogenophaga sp.]MDM7950538.1 hypothetical protein [Hydrogenophaga sp.]
MNTSTHDFVSVEMRGLKAALVARAQAQRVSVSELVRSAVARDLGLSVVEGAPKSVEAPQGAGHAVSVKLSIRMTAMEAGQLAAGARAAGLSRGAYLAGLVAHVPVLTGGASRIEHIAVLNESTAELATFSRNLHLLSTLLRRSEGESSRLLRLMLDTLARDVRQHLDLASSTLADLQPRRPATAEPRGRNRPGNRRIHP